LNTLWFTTGTLCNLSCEHCYIESTPTNDRLVYLSAGEVESYLEEIAGLGLPTEEIGFTGGEPFMNPEIVATLEAALTRDHRVLVLTNGMRPMLRHAPALLRLRNRFGERLAISVSLDHSRAAEHESLRGAKSWQPALARRAGLRPADSRPRLFAEHGIGIDATDAVALVLFPEMGERLDVSEITVDC